MMMAMAVIAVTMVMVGGMVAAVVMVIPSSVEATETAAMPSASTSFLLLFLH
jgi:uncharacterized membrane protein